MPKLSALILAALLYLHVCDGQLTIPDEPNVLTPPYFNIATGKRIEATATCGEEEPQVFCKLTGGPNEYGYNENLYQGQFCDVCDVNDPTKSHPIKYAIDGTEKWWQSPPLSQGSEYNKINVTIHLGQVFHVAYVIIKFANSPRAGTWVLERSSDHGETFQPWQYFANSDSDCHNLFGIDAFEEITGDNSVICTSQYSDVVPLERGEVIVSVINNRPGAKNFSHSPVLQEWSKATDVRLRLLRTKTLLGHLMAVQRQDPTVTRRYFYSIKDVSIGGRCVCNGHADTCLPDPLDRYKLKCECVHNTCGDSCEYCCPGFVQKAWRAAVPESANDCESCNCHGHSNECVYDEQVAIRRQSLDLAGNYEGGGVCKNCAHNTAGINCEKCVDGYYRPANVSPRETNGCQPCDCDSAFTVGTCEPVTGRCYCKPKFDGDRCDSCAPGYHMFPECEPCPCYYNATRDGICLPLDEVCPCKYNFAGKYCSECASGFYNFPECTPCTCTGQGAISDTCDPYTGQCTCDEGFGGLYCDQCSPGYFNYPICQTCSCYTAFTNKEVCDSTTGRCFCIAPVTGDSCNQCEPGYYDFPQCKECQCTSPGSANSLCDQETGKCQCKPNFKGPTCDECGPEYYNYPNCVPCDCDIQGSQRTTCDPFTGQCTCFSYIAGRRCDRCAPDYFNFPRCEDCKCNPLGIKSIVPGVCLAFTTGQCDCKDNVVGKYCDMCAPLHHNLTLGCVACNCFLQGTLDGVAACDSEEGDCWCKPYTCSQKCSQCETGFFGLQERNYFGCTGCQCNRGGAMSQECESVDGQCPCKEGITGRKCDNVVEAYYYPTLLQHKFEVEDGRAGDDEILRFGFSEEKFPGFSMKGYGEFSVVQRKLIVPVNVESHGLYKILFYYVHADSTSTANVTLTPVSADGGSEQSFQIVFEPSAVPTLQTAKTSLVLNAGEWHINIEGGPGLLIDYIVLLPSEYYEPGILQARVTEPCKPTLELTERECLMYEHPDLDGMPSALFADFADLNQRDAPTTAHPTMVLLDGNSVQDEQKSIRVSLDRVTSSGRYVLVLEYASLEERKQTIEATVSDSTGLEYSDVKFNVYSCAYSFICRQVALTPSSDVMVFDVSVSNINVVLSVDSGEMVYVKSVYAIPYKQWTMEYVEPRRKCITKEGPEFDECIAWAYPIPATAQVIDAEISNSGGGEEGGDGGGTVPSATDKDTNAKFLGNGEEDDVFTVDMDLAPGRYVFLLHYFNPKHLSFTPGVVIAGGIVHEGVANISYCPSGDGCRAVFTTDSGAVIVDITEPSQTMTITTPAGNSFFLDYVLAIPDDSYSAGLLELKPIDNSRRFFDECYGVGNEGLVESASEVSEFCNDSIFTLTTDFNDGALPCDCSGSGTLGGGQVDCEDYGGQCPCKRNVIGRKCDKCKTGYFGWPDCRSCDCDGALCDEVNGNCICPPNTITPDCNQCQPFTHSFHPLAGCVACDCHQNGVENAADLGCSQEDGQCRCKENVEGIKCDRCKPGYFGFPDCRPCVCDQRGRKSEGCDPVSGQCLCKENVEGQQCDRCKPGTFYLDGNNGLGCTSCFCFGATAECSSTQYPTREIVNMDGWRLLNLRTDDPDIVRVDDSVSIDIEANGGALDASRANLYWAAPKAYLTDRIGSYGGDLRFVIDSQAREYVGGRGDSTAGEASAPAPLTSALPSVILEGNGMVIGWTNRDGRGYPDQVTLKLVETNFVHQATGNPVSREEMMMVLGPLTAMHIHASDDPNAIVVSISGVSMTTTDYDAERNSGETIPTVEECICPQGYTGHSCQQCDVGHYREQRGRFLGFCAECDCYGHCDYCGPSGELLDPDDCKHHTTGDRCEKCEDGYIGDPTSREPDACQHCPCPYPSEEGNFATKCEYDTAGEVVCFCETGYIGEKCDQCSLGYFGNPTLFGGDCKECNCHGNLDSNLLMEICDPFTGECSDCQHNTGGKYCERCADGYFGDAIIAKNCTRCPCDECGTLQCDHSYGFCACKGHVIGIECDQCEPGYWNLDSCNGCMNCDCAVGAVNVECDTITGKCDCAPNVIGQKCDRCAPGHWDYSAMGCKPCNCRNNGDCNPVNGDCKCPPGITGKQCDQCELPREILPLGGLRCESCDTCTHDLLDTIEPETIAVKTATTNLSQISVGLEAAKRLDALDDRADQVSSDLDQARLHIEQTETNVEKLLNAEMDSLNEILMSSGDMEEELSGEASTPVLNLLEDDEPDTFISLKIELGRTEDAVSGMCNESQALLESTTKTNQKISDLDNDVTTIDNDIELFTSEAIEFLDELKEETTEDGEEYLQKLNNAQMLIARMKARAFKPMNDVANDEFIEAEDLFGLVNINFTLPADDLVTRVTRVSNDLTSKIEKMKEMRKRLNDATNTVTEVDAMNAENRKALNAARDAVNNILIEWENINNIIRDSETLLSGTPPSDMSVLDTDELKRAIEDLQVVYDTYQTGLVGMEELVNQSIEHALSLKADADEMIRIVDEVRRDPRTTRAVEAANRYQDITNIMEKARNAADKADLDATEAKNDVESSNLAENATLAEQNAGALLSEVTRVSEEKIPSTQRDLENAQSVSLGMSARVGLISEKLDDINSRIQRLNPGRFDGDIEQIDGVSADANGRTDKVLKTLNEMQLAVNNAPNASVEVAAEITEVEEALGEIRDNVDEAKAQVDDLLDRKERVMSLPGDLGLDGKIRQIRKMIELSRSVADRVTVSMKFKSRTLGNGVYPQYAQVHIPQQAFDLSNSMKVEVYVNVSKSADNSLLFLGDVSNPDGDYVALETIGGRVYYYYKAGLGSGELVSDVEINDEQWHQIVIQRDGVETNLTVYYISEDEGRSDLESSVVARDIKTDTFSSDQVDATLPMESTPLLVGGMPLDPSRGQLKNTQMEGCIRGVKVNEESVGLWNFVHYNGPQPGKSCPWKPDGPNRWWKFRGLDSYIRVDQKQLIQKGLNREGLIVSFVVFKFKTQQREALLFFVGENTRNFMAIEIRNGKLTVTFNFGWEEPRHEVSTSEIDVSTFKQELFAQFGVIERAGGAIVILFLNGQPAIQASVTEEDYNPNVMGDVWFGGIHRFRINPEFRDFVTNIDVHYRGCIDDLRLHFRNSYNIYDATERVGVTPGCNRSSLPPINDDDYTYVSIADHYPSVKYTDSLTDEPVIPPVVSPTETATTTTTAATTKTTTTSTEPPFSVETVQPEEITDYIDIKPENDNEEQQKLVYVYEDDQGEEMDTPKSGHVSKGTALVADPDDVSFKVNGDNRPSDSGALGEYDHLDVEGDSTGDGGLESTDIDVKPRKERVKQGSAVFSANDTEPAAYANETPGDLSVHPEFDTEWGAQVAKDNVDSLEEDSGTSVLPVILVVMGVVIGVVLIAAVVSAVAKGAVFGRGTASAPPSSLGFPPERAPLNQVDAQRVAHVDW